MKNIIDFTSELTQEAFRHLYIDYINDCKTDSIAARVRFHKRLDMMGNLTSFERILQAWTFDPDDPSYIAAKHVMDELYGTSNAA